MRSLIWPLVSGNRASWTGLLVTHRSSTPTRRAVTPSMTCPVLNTSSATSAGTPGARVNVRSASSSLTACSALRRLAVLRAVRFGDDSGATLGDEAPALPAPTQGADLVAGGSGVGRRRHDRHHAQLGPAHRGTGRNGCQHVDRHGEIDLDAGLHAAVEGRPEVRGVAV